MRISDWSSDVCSSDLLADPFRQLADGAHALLAELVDAALQLRNDIGLQRIERDGGEPQDRVLHAEKGDDDQERAALDQRLRSEGRRVGKEWVSTCRSRWSAYD